MIMIMMKKIKENDRFMKDFEEQIERDRQLCKAANGTFIEHPPMHGKRTYACNVDGEQVWKMTTMSEILFGG